MGQIFSAVTWKYNRHYYELILAFVTNESIFWPNGNNTQGIEMIRMDNNFNEIARKHIGDNWGYTIYQNPHLSSTTDGAFILTSQLAREITGDISAEIVPWITKIDPFGNSPLLSPHNHE